MIKQEQLNYNRIAEAIEYINTNFKDQPSLSEIAEKVHLSPFHFQRLFTEWAGVSPKKFMQYISVEYAKRLLKEKQTTLFEVAYQTGLSGTGRLHDLFVNIEGMTPGEFKNGGESLSINYSFVKNLFGNMIVGSTSKGICHMAFIKNKDQAFKELQCRFPNAHFNQITDSIQQNGLLIFRNDWNKLSTIKLHLNGTPFQLKVWETLLKIPLGNLTTYGSIAAQIKNSKASRAVGTAIGKNPVAFLIDTIEGKVILVGHSKNGIMISQVAEYIPQKIEKLIYLAAYLIPDGKTQSDYSSQDQGGVLKPYVTMHPEMGAHTLQPEIYKKGLYHDCNQGITELAKLLLSHEPVQSAITPLRLTEKNYGSVRRFYIECTEDKAVTPYIQKKMYVETPCEKVYSMKTSHSPFFSKPQELCAIFNEIAVI